MYTYIPKLLIRYNIKLFHCMVFFVHFFQSRLEYRTEFVLIAKLELHSPMCVVKVLYKNELKKNSKKYINIYVSNNGGSF